MIRIGLIEFAKLAAALGIGSLVLTVLMAVMNGCGKGIDPPAADHDASSTPMEKRK